MTAYRVEALLREKNGKQVWAVSLPDGSPALLKRYPHALPEELADRLKQLGNPFLAEVLEAGTDEEGFFLLEREAEGVSVQTLLDGGKQFRPRELRRLAREIGQALKALHAVGIVHRDVKPDNILMDEKGHFILTDYDAARLHSEERDRDTRYLGTVGYAPPEQYGFGQTDSRSDLYALGATLFELKTGRLPGEKERVRGAMAIPIRRCLSLDPAKRYGSAESLLREVRFGPWLRSLGAVILCSLLCTAFLLWKPEASPEPSPAAATALRPSAKPVPVPAPTPSPDPTPEPMPLLSKVPMTEEGFQELLRNDTVYAAALEAMNGMEALVDEYGFRMLGGPDRIGYDGMGQVYYVESYRSFWEIWQNGTVAVYVTGPDVMEFTIYTYCNRGEMPIFAPGEEWVEAQREQVEALQDLEEMMEAYWEE